jgi:hypothetical protein
VEPTLTVCLVREPAPAVVWMGSGGSGAAPERLYSQYAGWLRPSEFEERSHSAPVRALSSPSRFPSFLLSSRPELVTMVGGGIHGRARARPTELASPRPATELARGRWQSTRAAGGARPLAAGDGARVRPEAEHAHGWWRSPPASALLGARQGAPRKKIRFRKKKKMSESMTCGVHL